MPPNPDVLRDRIHEGGMGMVWRGAQSALALRIPVHIVDPDPDTLPALLDRICDEAHRGASTAAAVIDGFGPPVIAMERVAGETLEDRLSAGARFDPARAVDLVRQILAALAVLHDTGMVHGDLRPGSVVLGPDGVSLVDFSDVRATDLEFIAPEVLDGHPATVASDVFAVGAILQALTDGSRVPALRAVDHACARAMAEVPAARFPDARAFAAALR